MYFPELIFECINVTVIGIILKCGFLFFLFIDMCFGMIDICHYSAGVYYSQTRNWASDLELERAIQLDLGGAKWIQVPWTKNKCF